MSKESDFRTLVTALCMRFTALMFVCVFAENIAIWMYLLSPHSAFISAQKFVFIAKILAGTVFLAFGGVVLLAFLEPEKDT